MAEMQFLELYFQSDCEWNRVDFDSTRFRNCNFQNLHLKWSSLFDCKLIETNWIEAVGRNSRNNFGRAVISVAAILQLSLYIIKKPPGFRLSFISVVFNR